MAVLPPGDNHLVNKRIIMHSRLWRVGKEELKYIKKAINNGLTGAMTSELETRFAEKFGVNYAIAVNSGTSALHCAVEGIGIQPEDEIIVPPLTFMSTAFAPLYAGAIPVFADVDPSTFNIDPDSILKKITDRTKAIIVVSLYGLPAEMDRIMSIAKKYNLRVIEDNAQCVFGRYKGKIAGTIGDVSIFSLQRSKHLTAGGGGMIVTNDKILAERMRKFSDLGYTTLKAKSGAHGLCKEKLQQPDFKRHESLGYNFRMSEVCAAMTLAQVTKLEELVQKRIAIAQLYKEAISGCDWLIPQRTPAGVTHSYWTFAVKLNRNKNNVSWKEVCKVFLEEGGEPFYGAWSLSYLEPALEGKSFPGHNIKYCRGLCPVAESLQPYIIQFKTNFENLSFAVKQTDTLKRTIKRFNGG